MADLLEQERLQPRSCPKRDRDDCIRDAIAAWNSAEMHKRAAEGHKQNMLSVALDGSEDHLGRGDAARLWVEADMPRKRAAALADVDAMWSAGSLTWDKHRDLIAAFPPRGQIDEYVEGQEDEGEPPRGEPWTDREDASGDSEDVHGKVRRSGERFMTDDQLVQVGDISERLRKVEDVLAGARELGNPHVVMTLEQARHTLMRQLTGAKVVDPVVAAAARDVRLANEAHLLVSRARCTAARAAQMRMVECKSKSSANLLAGWTLRRERMRLRLLRVSNGNFSKGPAKGFDAADLGQGQKDGGGQVYKRRRMELVNRVASAFPALAGDLAENWPRTWRMWDAQMARKHGASWGHMMRDEMRRLQHLKSAGDGEAFKRFARRLEREVPRAEIRA
jgi:hypothetical protein